MENNYQKTKSLTALVTQDSESNLSDYQKKHLAKLLAEVLLSEEHHRYLNQPYELPEDFCIIYLICRKLKEEADEKYNTLHQLLLRYSNKSWDKISFEDIEDSFAILFSLLSNNSSDNLKLYIKKIRKILRDLCYISHRHTPFLNKLFKEKQEENLKQNILLGLCVSDKENFYKEKNISFLEKKISNFIENPYNE